MSGCVRAMSGGFLNMVSWALETLVRMFMDFVLPLILHSLDSWILIYAMIPCPRLENFHRLKRGAAFFVVLLLS